MLQELKLETMAGGAALEAVNIALGEAFRNIVDPNVAAKAVRQVTLVIKVKPNDKRNSLEISFQAVSKLPPAEALTTEALLEQARDGSIAVMELFRGQDPGRTVLPGCPTGQSYTVNPFETPAKEATRA